MFWQTAEHSCSNSSIDLAVSIRFEKFSALSNWHKLLSNHWFNFRKLCLNEIHTRPLSCSWIISSRSQQLAVTQSQSENYGLSNALCKMQWSRVKMTFANFQNAHSLALHQNLIKAKTIKIALFVVVCSRAKAPIKQSLFIIIFIVIINLAKKGREQETLNFWSLHHSFFMAMSKFSVSHGLSSAVQQSTERTSLVIRIWERRKEEEDEAKVLHLSRTIYDFLIGDSLKLCNIFSL